MAELGVTTREVVARLWGEVAAEQASRFESLLEPLPEVEPLAQNRERWYLNQHWAVDRAPASVVSSARFKRQLKNRAAQFIVGVLERHFEEEQEFRAHLVRLQNTLTVECDRLSLEVRQVHEALRRELERLWQAHAALEDRVASLERRAAVTSFPGARD